MVILDVILLELIVIEYGKTLISTTSLQFISLKRFLIISYKKKRLNFILTYILIVKDITYLHIFVQKTYFRVEFYQI
jgi:phage-related holin